MRLMWSHRDPSARRSGVANLFVKNLHTSINSACLESLFSQFRTILSCKVPEEDVVSKGYGFVQFDSDESAINALSSTLDTEVEGKKLYVSKFVKKGERMAAANCEQSFTNLYVKNLAEDMTGNGLKDMFSAFGEVSSCVIMINNSGKSRGFGFVNFKLPEDAKKAVCALNGSVVGSKTLFVGRAQPKDERTMILRRDYKDMVNSCTEKWKASNLYVKNLNFFTDDIKLRGLFSSFGELVSAKIMRQENGQSKGFGFVCFSCPEDARKALTTLNGACFEGRSLYVAIAQHKQDRIQELQRHFVQYPPMPLYLPDYNTFSPLTNPYYFNFPLYPLPFLHHSISYQHLGANLGNQHPYAIQSFQQKSSSCVPLGQSYLGSSGNSRNCFYQQHVCSTTPSSIKGNYIQ